MLALNCGRTRLYEQLIDEIMKLLLEGTGKELWRGIPKIINNLFGASAGWKWNGVVHAVSALVLKLFMVSPGCLVGYGLCGVSIHRNV